MQIQQVRLGSFPAIDCRDRGTGANTVAEWVYEPVTSGTPHKLESRQELSRLKQLVSRPADKPNNHATIRLARPPTTYLPFSRKYHKHNCALPNWTVPACSLSLSPHCACQLREWG